MRIVKINLNENVKVKLTDLGKDVYYHQFDELNKQAGREIVKPRFPDVDADGYSTFQLHHFMNVYGSYMSLGFPNVIEPIEIIYDDYQFIPLDKKSTD